MPLWRWTGRRHGLLGAAVLVVAWILLAAGPGARGQGPCGPPVTNAIACENSQLGDPPADWDVTGAGDPTIQGYATEISVNRGETVRFKIDTDARSYQIDIYRLGYYGGLGARRVATILPWVPLPQPQPPCLSELITGLVDCGNWEESAAWAVPPDAVSGVYVARLVRHDSGGASHIVFVVRDDSGGSDLLFQTSDTTWQAYNEYGGQSLYAGSPGLAPPRAYKVSYNRPFSLRGTPVGRAWLFASEYPMIRWLEANGYDVSYTTGVDTARRGAELLEHQVFLSVGHDEYWSAEQRAHVEAARDAGVHLAFFSGNESFWKTRWEPSIDGSATPYRTLVSYKETHANAKIDPLPAVWTGTWRDPRFSPPADGGRPENALTGTFFAVNCCRQDAITIPEPLGKLRFWRNTSVAALAPGQQATLPLGFLGYEWDEDRDNGARPPGLVRLSSTTVNVPQYLRDYGSSYGPGTATHSLTLYRHPSGALVFGAGTIRWLWGLDGTHDTDPATPAASRTPDPRMQQATVNLLADMGVQPATLQPGLVPATASTDTTPPTSVITSPAPGATVFAETPVTITGTATDAGGGTVAAVEVSVDGGETWHRATGSSSWSYTWTPQATGSVVIGSSAVDDSGNIEIPTSSVSLTVADPPLAACPCSLWPSAPTPAIPADPDQNPVEVGVKFRSDLDGFITALRFYKGPGNSGPHVGHLWTASGALLASVTFSGETATGWQQASLPAPVPITKNTTYVASYHTPTGHYAVTPAYFATTGVLALPLRAPATSGVGNGVFRYGASGFPTSSFNGNNYWVDVVFDTVPAPPDSTAPTVTSVSPDQGAVRVNTGASVTATFSEPMDPTTLGTSTFVLRDAGGMVVPAAVTWDASTLAATLTPSAPLGPLTTYTATLKGGSASPRVTDVAGNPLAADHAWSFTTDTAPTCPCTIWSRSATPAIAADPDSKAIEVGVKFRSDLDGFITGLRFYKGPGNSGPHIGNLWTSTGQRLASVTFSAETAVGWQEAILPAPVAISRNTLYVASYHAPTGHYSASAGYFVTAGVSNPPLRAPATGAVGGNGVYRYGASGFPTSTVNGNNYWVDVVFDTSPAPDSTPPTVSSIQPAPGTTGVEVSTNVTATFSEPVNPATVDAGTMELRDPSGSLVPAAVSYDPATLTATLDPTGPLAANTTYTVTIRGGATDPRVKDFAGNPLAASVSSSFTTVSLACPCTIWSGAAVPAVAADPDANPIEVGVKFRSDVDGFITALRFYKGSSNTGTHVGHLWTASGTLLAAVTFTNETGTGWQQAPLPAPVAISRNTTYVASYHTPVGHYAVSAGYFATSGVSNPPLRALANGEDGGNGVFAYGAGGFPASSFNGNNYWVDVVFSTVGGAPDTTPPTIASFSPASGAIGVGTGTAVTVTFSEPMAEASVGSGTFELRDPSNALVPATVTYNATTNAATLRPTAPLATSSTYTATIRGGSAGVKDAAGNALAQSFTWSFTTAGATGNFLESVVFTGLTQPTAVRFSPDGRVFVAEKSGLIKVFDDLSDTTPTIFADLRTRVHNFWDRGLLGLALHPGFPAIPWVYVLYTHDAAIGGIAPRWGTADATSDGCPFPPGATEYGCVVSARLSRLQADGSVMTGAEQVLVEGWGQQYPSHSIGALAFGSDGALYVSGGDGASFNFVDYGQAGSPLNPLGDPPVPIGSLQTPPSAQGGALRSQSPRRLPGEPVVLNGAILRLDPETGGPLPDNPLFSHPDPMARRIVGYGLRNPFRLTLRPGTQEVWVGDVGWSTWEELNRVAAPTGPAVANFGWPCYEGPNRQPAYDAANLAQCEQLYAGSGTVTAPYFTYAHTEKIVAGESCPTGGSSITGLAFYNGGSYPTAYNGALFFADYSRRCIWVMFPGANGLPEPTSRTTFLAPARDPVDLQIGPGGDLFYVDLGGGTIRRVAFIGGNQPPTAVIQAAPLSGPTPLTVAFDGTGSSDPDPGQTLTFSWDLDGDGVFGDATDPRPSFTYAAAATYTVRLRVTDPGDASHTTSIVIWAGNTPPTAVIDSPLPTFTWRAGETIAFSGHASDVQQGALPASALSWSILLHHCPSNCHVHPLQTLTGVASGSISAPDHEYPSHLEFRLTATDAGGLQHTASVLVQPTTVALTFQSSPPGLELIVNAVGRTTPFTHTVVRGSTNSLSGPSPQVLAGTTYEFVSWSDGGAQSHNVTADAVTTYTATYAPAPGSSVTVGDTLAADFAAGAPGSGAYVTQVGDGEVALAPLVGAEFSGSALPAGWFATAWQTGGSAIPGSGVLTISGARAGTNGLFSSGRVLEFIATFRNALAQHVGFGLTFAETPFAVFSTFTGDGLYARTHNGVSSTSTRIPGSWLGAPHRYRIEWTPSAVTYSVDGTVVASHPLAVSAQMRPLASDFTPADAALSVDWLHVTPYAPAGTFLSRVLDAGAAVTWGQATWAGTTPAGTSLTVSTRTGSTPVPDASWTSFAPLPGPGSVVGGTGRYLQYRVELATTVGDRSPSLQSIGIVGTR
jgi:glucose/arabinose dehydrogenase